MSSVSATQLTAQIEADTTLLLDSLEGLLASAQARTPTSHDGSHLHLNSHAFSHALVDASRVDDGRQSPHRAGETSAACPRCTSGADTHKSRGFHLPSCVEPVLRVFQVETVQSLANVTCALQRDALLADFETRVACVQAATATAKMQREQLLETLRERAEALVQHVRQSGAERIVLTRIGEELVAEDLDAPDDPQGIAKRLYELAE